MTPTNRTTAELREAIEKLRSLVSDWRNADTRAGLCADPDDLDLEGLSEAAEEANYCYDMAATHFMLWGEDILDALLPQPPALGGNDLQNERTAEKLLKNFEDEDWNDKRERLEQNIIDAVSALMIEHMGGASKTVFAPQEGCPYQITIEYGEVKDGSFN